MSIEKDSLINVQDVQDHKELNKSESLKDSKRTRCEIWSRVMGYHRPISSFNIGKKQEFLDRKNFKEPR
jgi:anaerobic ribonucleoside-triphosphate reductase